MLVVHLLTFSAGSPEGQCGVNLILDLDEGIQHHWTAVVKIDTVLLHLWLVSRLIWVLMMLARSNISRAKVVGQGVCVCVGGGGGGGGGRGMS